MTTDETIQKIANVVLGTNGKFYPKVQAEMQEIIKELETSIRKEVVESLHKFIKTNSFYENKCDVIYTAELASFVDNL